MRMHSALTQWGVTPAPATLATLEMVSTVQVRHSNFELGSFITDYITLQPLYLQISMNVNWRHIHAAPMPTALTQMAASTVHVQRVLREMVSTVQVNYLCTNLQCLCTERESMDHHHFMII